MSKARYCIGIDLGTSNCALSYASLETQRGDTQILNIFQYENLDTLSESFMLPSFLYFPAESKEGESRGDSDTEATSLSQIVGHFARKQTAFLPDRVIHSAKSWLSHSGVDREAKLLPWSSQALEASRKLSPVEASAAYLNYLRYVWDETLAKEDKSLRFDNQDIVITVPASFDPIAQKLTREAARLAGYQPGVRLLEEPQAAFYSWLERQPEEDGLVATLPELAERAQTVLVCDIGGGTSDFSLFEVMPIGEEGGLPELRRIAVSDHLLLGGDNIDLGIAHLLEQQMVGEGERLDPHSWRQLIAQSRDLKERAFLELSNESADTLYHVSITQPGSNLFGSVRSASIERQAVLDYILEGFFPICQADDLPEQLAGGLVEMGLPYTRDMRIPRHIASFLGGRKVDALLFNGGTVMPELLQERLLKMIGEWQSGYVPRLLGNPEPHLAVARGAAYAQYALRKETGYLIEGGTGYALYLEIDYKKKRKKKQKAKSASEIKYAVCILPQGTEADSLTRLLDLNLHLRVNNPVRFQAYSSTRRAQDKAGSIVQLNDADFQSLPPLQTIAQLPPAAPMPESGTVSVSLESSLNALGILQVYCVSVRRILERYPRWELVFNLRADSDDTDKVEKREKAESLKDTAVSSEVLNSALQHIQNVFPVPGEAVASDNSAARFIKSLETLIALKRGDWNTALLRSLWEPLATGITRRALSAEHELAWVMAAGYCLRPGYGFPWDEYRINQLWFLEELSLAFPKEKAIREQVFILWRRVAGGLSREQQSQLFEKWYSLVEEDTKSAQEAIRMLGAFERLPEESRLNLVSLLTERVEKRQGKDCQVHLWALGRLLNRAPLYGGEGAVLPMNQVARTFEAFKNLDWTSPAYKGMLALFAQSARKLNHREHDVSEELREAILAKMEASQASEHQLAIVREFVPIAMEDLQVMFGESLPTGLAMG